jgi:hypothetical protein
MTIVIPTRNNVNSESLRFSLRSICLHHDVTRCILIGGKPGWYTGEHIPFPEYDIHRKEENIRDKVLVAAKVITGPFLFANDDHFITAPITKVYNKGLLSDCIKGRTPNGSYTMLLKNTLAHFWDMPNCDTHCPMWMDSELVDNTNFYWPMWGIGFKTCYAAVNKIESVYYRDLKIDKWTDEDKGLFFSTGVNFKEWGNIYELWPNKSIFEK